MKKLISIFFVLLNFTNCMNAQKSEREININSIFNKMELQGIETKKPLLYGYFFYDNNKENLEKLKDKLLKEKYSFVRLEKVDKKNHILHIEKVEIHSRASLLKREIELDEISKNFNVETYDGWDVGNSDFDKFLEKKNNQEIYKIANELYEIENADKAIIAYEKCIQRKIHIDTCYHNQGYSYIMIGEFNTGIEKMKKAVVANPNYYKAIYNIAAFYYDKQEFKKSIEYYEKAMVLKPNDDSVYYGIAASQYVLGLIEKSELNCLKALEINPTNENANWLNSEIKKR